MKKIIGYIVILLLFAGTIAGIYYCVQYYTRDLSYYEQKLEQLEEENRLQKEKYEELIEGYVLEISEYELTIKQMTESMDSLESQLQNSNNNYQTALQTIEEYKTQVSSLQSNITTLEEQLESLQTLNSNYSYKISQLESSIATLNQTIATLNDQIKYYEELIESYNFDNKSVVTFKVNGKTHDVIVVENGQPFNFEVEDPTLLGYSFNGWSKDGIIPITLQGYEFTEDTTLTSLMTEENQVYYGLFGGSSNYYIDGEDRRYGTGRNFYASIDITGTNVDSIRFYCFDDSIMPDSPGYVPNGSDIFEKYGVTELKNYASIENYKLTIEIPTSVISAIDSERYFTSDIYLKCQFEIIDNTFTLTDYFQSYSSTRDVSLFVYSESEINNSSLFIAETNLNKEYTVNFVSSVPNDNASATGNLNFVDGIGSFEWGSFSDDCTLNYTDDCLILVERLPVGVYRMSLYLKNNITTRVSLVHASTFYFENDTLKYIPFPDNGEYAGSYFVIESCTEMA